MNRPAQIDETDLHAFIDGELDAARTRAVAQALSADPALAARVAAFDADRRHLAALYAPIATAPIPDAWRARIEEATAPTTQLVFPPRKFAWYRRPALGFALAACLAIVAFVSVVHPFRAQSDTILAEATAASRDETPPLIRMTGAALQDAAARDATLRRAVGLPVHAPDLAAQHWRLIELETYVHAASLHYTSDTGQALTVYVRPSAGPPRFDLLKDGKIRTCIWQDEVVGAVMMGDMSAGQMMRVASAAYLALNL